MTADATPGPAVPEIRLVTISAAYGAGGSVVAPALAQRLGVRFLQRATTNEGDVTGGDFCAEALAPDEPTPAHWLLASLTHAMPLGPTQSPLPSHWDEEDLRSNASRSAPKGKGEAEMARRISKLAARAEQIAANLEQP